MNWLTLKDVAKTLSVSEYTVGVWLRQGKLKGSKLGGKLWRVSEAEVQRFVKESEVNDHVECSGVNAL